MTCGFTFRIVHRLPTSWWTASNFHPEKLGKWPNLTDIFQMGLKHQAIIVWRGFQGWIGAHLFELTQRWFICSLCWAYEQHYLHCVLFDGNPMPRLFLHKEKTCSPILQGSTQNLRLRLYEHVPKCWKRPRTTDLFWARERFAFTASGILQQPLDRYDRASHGHQEAVLIDLGASTISGRGLSHG